MTIPNRVLHIIRSAGIGGVEQQARDLAAELQRRGRGIGLAILATEPLKPHVREWHEQAISPIVFDDRRGRFFGLDRMLKLRRFIDSLAPDLVHLHYALPDSLIWNDTWAATGTGRTVVATLHHALRWSDASFTWRTKQRLAILPVKRFIATTPAGSALLAERLPAKKVRVVPCGVTDADISPKSDRVTSRHAFGLADDDKVLGCVCRIHPEKGVFELAYAVSSLARKHPKLRLLIAGDGPALAKLRAETAGMPNVRCLGRIERLDQFYAALDVFAMPSVEEGFGVVYIEAARFGLPSIACKLPTVSHVIDDGRNGWLVEPDDRQHLVALIDRIIERWHEVEQMGELAALKAARFDMKTVVDETEAVYAELV